MPLDEAAAQHHDAVPLIASYLAGLAVTLVLLHMPDRLIFGGGVMKTPGLIESLRTQTETLLAGYVIHPRLDPGLQTYIAAPGLGDDAGITGAIALGHPLGMTGARITGTVALELARTGGRYGLATMCVGVGQGAAVLIERV